MYRIFLRGLGIVSIFWAVYSIHRIYLVFQQGAFTYASIFYPELFFPVLIVLCLLACGLSTWIAPRYAAWLALGAFVFSASNVARAIYPWGLLRGLTNLQPNTYLLLSIYLLVTILIWWFAKCLEKSKM